MLSNKKTHRGTADKRASIPASPHRRRCDRGCAHANARLAHVRRRYERPVRAPFSARGVLDAGHLLRKQRHDWRAGIHDLGSAVRAGGRRTRDRRPHPRPRQADARRPTQGPATDLRDRRALIERGFRASSFAYPYGDFNASVATIVRMCGYASARRAWGLRPIGRTPCEKVTALAESSPPTDRWATRALGIRSWHSFAEIATAIARADAGGGGWLTLVFHRVSERPDRDGYSVAPETFEALLRWLDGRTAYGTYVRTVEDVVAPSPVGRLLQLPPQRSRADVA